MPFTIQRELSARVTHLSSLNSHDTRKVSWLLASPFPHHHTPPPSSSRTPAPWAFQTETCPFPGISGDLTCSRRPALPLPLARVMILGRPWTFLNPSLIFVGWGWPHQVFWAIWALNGKFMGHIRCSRTIPFYSHGTSFFCCFCQLFKASSPKGCLWVWRWF